LKRFYNFTDDKCQAFNPDDRSHSSDRLQPIHCVEYSPHPPSSSISSSSSVTAAASVAIDYHTVLNQFIEQHFSVFINHQQQQQSNSMNAPLDPKLVVGFLTILREIVMDFNRVSILLNNDPVDFTVSKRTTTISAKKQQQQKHDNDYSSSVDDVDDEDDTSSGGNNKGKGMKRKSLSSTSTTTKKTKKALTTTTTATTTARTPVRISKSKKRRLNICSDDDDGGEDEDDDLEDGDYKG